MESAVAEANRPLILWVSRESASLVQPYLGLGIARYTLHPGPVRLLRRLYPELLIGVPFP